MTSNINLDYNFKVKDDSFRQNVAEALKKLFKKELTLRHEETTDLTDMTRTLLMGKCQSKYDSVFVNLERSIYNFAIHEAESNNIIKKWDNRYFLRIYVDRLRSIYTNLSNNEDFRKKILAGEFTFEQLSKITHQEMCPEMWNDLIQMKIKRDESKYKNRIEANTDVYVCKKCRSRKCVYIPVQTRSADEQMSIFVSCLDCGANWKN